MADQVKEISNGTYFIGALSNGVAIASTNATTQNVVKDIYVQNNQLTALGAALNFNVNNVTVASLSSSVSGSEIIDVSSTAVAQATATFEAQVFENWMNTSAANSRINTQTARNVNGFQASTAIAQSDAIVTAATTSSQIVSWAFVGANFYYYTHDNNSIQNLYRRTGGINGTQTLIASISSYQPVVFNGVDKFHWVTGSQIFTHNATTNTNSAVSLVALNWTGSTTSYPRISFANGLVFTQNTANPNLIFAINPTTGRMSDISSFASPGTDSVMEVFHTSGTYYLVTTTDTGAGVTGSIRVSTVSDTAVGPLTSGFTNPTATSVYNQTTYTPKVTIASHWPKIMSNGDFMFLSAETSGSVYVYKRFNVVTRTFATSFTIDVSTITPNAGASYQVAPFRTFSTTSDTANKTNTTFYPQTATLRVTGVQTTP